MIYYLGFIPVIVLIIYGFFFLPKDSFVNEIVTPSLIAVFIIISALWAIVGLMGGIR